MLEGEGTVFRVGKTTVAVRIPYKVMVDSTFPFKVGDKVTVSIQGDEIVVRKAS